MPKIKKQRTTNDKVKIAVGVGVGLLILKQRKDLKQVKRTLGDLIKAVDYNAQSLDMVGAAVDDHRNYISWLDGAVAQPFAAKAVKKGLKAA